MPRQSVSIVVPTYNRAHLIGRALRSALGQCGRDDEIIVVDDASSDGTEGVVAGFPGVRYERIGHGGAGRARNTGIALARHPLVGFLDSDDEFVPGTLECKRALMSARPDLVFCFSNFSGQPADGPLESGCLFYWSRDTRDWADILVPGTPLSRLVPHACASDPLVHIGSIYRAEMAHSYIAANTVIVNRALAGDALRFPEDLPTYEDWECFGRVARRGPCAYVAFDSAIQHSHGGPRLTDAATEIQVRTRLTLLERVWGGDADFLAAHASEYGRVCAEQRLVGAKVLLLAGRQAEARAWLREVPGGPVWARLARHVPIPDLALKAWIAARRRARRD
jgi:glycosyltransferase involved in cell wall biosynthesis